MGTAYTDPAPASGLAASLTLGARGAVPGSQHPLVRGMKDALALVFSFLSLK